MPELLECRNCRHAVSSTALQCPSCKIRYPLGATCSICGLVTSEKDSIPWEFADRTLELFHTSCANRVLPRFRANCRTCNADLRRPGSDRFAALVSYYYRDRSCPNCGELRPFGKTNRCHKCHFMAAESDIRTSKAPGRFGELETFDFHETCTPPPVAQRASTGCFPAILIIGLSSLFMISRLP
jgi:hypothetical protein